MSGNVLQIKLCPADFAFKLSPTTPLFKGQSLFDLDTAFLGLVKKNLSRFFFFLEADKRRRESAATASVQALALMQIPF